VLQLLAAPAAQAFTKVDTLYARGPVSAPVGWSNPDGVIGRPTNDCSTNINPKYSSNFDRSSEDYIEVNTWDSFHLLPGYEVSSVKVDVCGRYDNPSDNDSLTMLVRGSVLLDTQTSPAWNQRDDACNWRMGGQGWDITALKTVGLPGFKIGNLQEATAWSELDIANLYVAARRWDTGGTQGASVARVTSFRIIVTSTNDACGEVTPSALQFGTVAPGSYADRSFTMRNCGAVPLTGSVASSCSGPSFTVVAGAGAYLLGPNESRIVTVRFSPANTELASCLLDLGNTLFPAVPLSGSPCPAVLVVADRTLTAGDLSLDHADVTVSGSTLTVTGAHTFCKLTVQDGGKVTHLAGDTDGLRLTTLTDCTVDATSAISADARGYTNGGGPGGGGLSTGGGGAYGGEGGNSNVSAGSRATYGSVEQPTSLGSSGGYDWYGTHPGGPGGGAIRLTVAGVLRVDGRVSANGGRGPTGYDGGGSGGSLWITTGTLEGSGFVQANGGPGNTTNEGGGGGGRIAIYVNNCSPQYGLPMVTVDGGPGYQSGKPGTIYPSLDSLGIARGVIASSGSAELVTMPASLSLDSFQSDTRIRVISERRGYLLANALAMDISTPGTVSTAEALTPSTLPQGTVLNSSIVHFDPLILPGQRSASMTFDTDVLGVILTSTNLDVADAVLALPWVAQPAGLATRGLELAGAGEQDSLTLSPDRRTLQVSLGVASGMDGMRVLTAALSAPCSVTGVDDPQGSSVTLPGELALAPPQPNPMTGGTTLAFALPLAGHVSLDVYDVSGRHVVNLVNGVLPAGNYSRRWDGCGRDGRNKRAGIYFLRLTTALGQRMQRVTLLK